MFKIKNNWLKFSMLVSPFILYFDRKILNDGAAVIMDEDFKFHNDHDIGTIDLGPNVLSAKWSPIENKIISGSQDGTVTLWDLTTDTITSNIIPSPFGTEPEMGGVEVISWSPDGKKIAIGSTNGVVVIRDVTSGIVEKTIRPPQIDTTGYISSDFISDPDMMDEVNDSYGYFPWF